MARFDKQVGVITGAASGIGKEIALRYAAEGGTPVIADLNLDAAKATAEEIKGKGRPLRVKHVPSFKHDVKRRVPSVEKAKRVLGYEARVRLRDKLPEVIAYVKGRVRG